MRKFHHHGFSGSHRSGKTTSAQRFARIRSLKYLDMSTTSIVKELGIVVDLPMPVDQRIQLQEALYDHYVKILGQETAVCVTDRTFIDLVVYPLMDVSIGHPGFDSWLPEFAEKCRHAQMTYFSSTTVLDTYFPVPDHTKAVGFMSPDYAMGYNIMAAGLHKKWDRNHH